LPQLRGGTIKAYAVHRQEPAGIGAGIPTTDEAGLPGFYFSFWHAFWVPRGTPKEIVAELNKAAMKALGDPTIRKKLIDLSQDIFPLDLQTPEALGAFHKAEIEKWWPINQGGRHQGRMSCVIESRHSGAAQAEPGIQEPRRAGPLWIPGSRRARPGMTALDGPPSSTWSGSRVNA